MDLSSLLKLAMGEKALVAMFVRNQCTLHRSDELSIPKGELFEAFLAWAERNGRPCPRMNNAAFGRYLKAAAPRVTPQRRRSIPGDHASREWHFVRITLNEY